MIRCVKRLLSAIVIVFLIPIIGVKGHAQDISLRNNILYDATLTPNLGGEVGFDSLWSVGMDLGIQIFPRSKWTRHKFRHLLIAPEIRRYFSKDKTGHFVGANFLYTHYNMVGITFPFGLYRSVRHKRKQGNAIALGPQYGYVWQLSQKWRLEAEGGIDIGYSWSKVFSQDHPDKRIGYDKGFFLMPKLGVNIVYNIGRIKK